MYEARKICNLLLVRPMIRRFDLTNLRLNKLLYFIHGHALTVRREGLVRNHFLAWQHGPVIRPVFDSFKRCGDGAIFEPATFLEYESGQQKIISFDDISEPDFALIMRIFNAYDQFSTGELVDISHEPGGPWDLIYRQSCRDKNHSGRIPNDLIREHFLKKIGGQVAH